MSTLAWGAIVFVAWVLVVVGFLRVWARMKH